MSIYKSKEYSIERISNMIQDNKREQENDNENLGGW